MAVDSLSAYGYSQYVANSGTTLAERAKPKKGNLCVDPKTGYAADWDPKLYDPDRKVKKDNTMQSLEADYVIIATGGKTYYKENNRSKWIKVWLFGSDQSYSG